MNRVPGMRQNGGSPGPPVPPDLPYPCTIYQCSRGTEHIESCDGTCESFEPSENQVKLQNVAREFARNGMSFIGIPQGVPLPVSGIEIDLLELLCRIMAIEEMLFPLVDMDRESFDEKYREQKIDFLSNVLELHKDAVRRQRTVNALGIVEHPGLLGPDGNPIG